MKALRNLAIFSAMTFWFIAPHYAVQAQTSEVPYWATLRWDTVNMRKGPSQDFPIDWVYKRKGLPVQIVRTRESWRLVVDPEGTQGWIERSQLSPKLGALIVGEGVAELREAPNVQASILWRAEPGVVAELLRCRSHGAIVEWYLRLGLDAESPHGLFVLLTVGDSVLVLCMSVIFRVIIIGVAVIVEAVQHIVIIWDVSVGG